MIPTAQKSLSDIVLEDLPKTGYLRQSQLLKLIPFSPATLWRRVKSGAIPAPIKLSKGVTAWRIEDIRAWLRKLHNETRPLS